MKIDLHERFGLYIMSDVAGRQLASEIRSALESGADVIVDFANVKSVLTAFLNPAIGDLYAVFDADELDRRVRTVNTSDVNDASLERVRDHARQFYNDPAYRAAHEAAAASLDALFAS